MNNKFKVTFFTASLLASQFVISASNDDAKIYKCTSTKGAVFYNDKPCPKYDKEKKLRAVKDPKGGYSPNLNVNEGVDGFVKSDNGSGETFGSVEEKIAVEAIDAEIEKHSKESNSNSNTKASQTSGLGKSSSETKPEITKKDIAAMSGSQRENYYEKIKLEQARLAEVDAALEKALDK